MRHRATPILHVLVCAPVAALAAASIALPVHALAATPRPSANAPAPYVVAIDPGHGGSADNNNPDQPFDPGVVAANGLQEKDVTLDVARRLTALLRADQVDVVMTRSDDRYVDIGPRMQSAIDAGAQLFVSIHFNSFTDATTGGALVLYPGDDSLPFAQVMSDALATGLQPYGIGNDGVQSKPDLWVHATMPAVTVEGAYMTNSREADLLTRDDFRAALARAIRNGVEKQAPQIATLSAQITAWKAAHRAPAVQGGSGTSPNFVAPGTGGGGTVMRWLIVLSLLGALVRWRRRVAPVAVWAYAALRDVAWRQHAGRSRAGLRRGRRQVAGHELTLATSWKSDSLLTRPMSTSQRRRRSARRRAVLQRAARPAPTRRSVYDELWF
jgi:N-acetylmuramoyl-L-alanine amidase